jgi:SAM-dependent methyltransferase
MSKLTKDQDAYGRALLDFLEGRPAFEVVERDDGYLDVGGGPASYFASSALWPESERRALRHVRGRVLDVGAGAGRISLHLQEKGHEVVAIDNSPLAVEVCKRRGVADARLLPFTKIDKSLGVFDTVVMFGNNFGLSEARRERRSCSAGCTR